MPNWGIDAWMCEIYKPFNSCYINQKLLMENHISSSSERYDIDKNYKKKLKKEVNNSINILRFYLSAIKKKSLL